MIIKMIIIFSTNLCSCSCLLRQISSPSFRNSILIWLTVELEEEEVAMMDVNVTFLVMLLLDLVMKVWILTEVFYL